MPEYRFWQLYSDATPCNTPTLVKIQAGSYKDAVMQFCREHGMKVIEVNGDEVWFEDEHGAMMQHSVARR